MLNLPVCRIHAVTHPTSCNMFNSEKAAGLEPIITLCHSAKVRLTGNVWFEGKMFRNASGSIVDIIYTEDSQPPNLPQAVLVNLDDYDGLTIENDSYDFDKVVVVTPVRYAFEYKHRNKPMTGHRTQIPLSLDWARTIHSSQGDTVDSMTLDIYKKEQTAGLAYTGLSRTPDYRSFVLFPFKPQRLLNLNKSKQGAKFKRLMNYLKQLHSDTSKRYKRLKPDHLLARYKSAEVTESIAKHVADCLL